ncbi:hypothetical protein [Variovorax sp. 770b2]|uniref:hypothetical protein n=1 Tax=Variovorax sp. 770b2 TaxID=1566271 RepID=UPI0011603E4E|nr:hypothetical protein [Variovorax sp. 770b2]
MINRAGDHDFFIANTRKLKILKGGDKFKQYHEFLLAALDLLKEERFFPIEANEWEDAARACLERKISLEEVKNIQEKIEFFRGDLQKDRELLEENRKKSAIAELFQFAVEHPDDESRVDTRGTDISNGTGLAQAIDEFSFLYVEYFGREKDLVHLLKESFSC